MLVAQIYKGAVLANLGNPYGSIAHQLSRKILQWFSQWQTFKLTTKLKP